MGILGVRFPAFPAEGLTKALARSMDEVVIASNDVSVFNWSGKHNGSPIRAGLCMLLILVGFGLRIQSCKKISTRIKS